MTRFTLIAAAAFAGLSFAAPAAQAGNAGASLPACYNHVISACNNSRHPEACAEAGMNACDEYHANKGASSSQAPLNIKMVPGTGGKYRAILQEARPTREKVERIEPAGRAGKEPAGGTGLDTWLNR